MAGNEYFASINEVSKMLGVPAHTLRYWEKQFPTVVRPTTGAGGRRYYREDTVLRLKTIQDLLYNRGMTIAGVKKMIFGGDFSAVLSNEVRATSSIDEPVHVPESRIKTQNISEKTSCAAAIDATKIELAIGLLNQAKEILKP